MAPGLPQGTLSIHPPVDVVDPSSKSVRDSRAYRHNADVQTPKRSGEELDDPSHQRLRKESQEYRIAGDTEFRERHRPVTWDRAAALRMGATRRMRFAPPWRVGLRMTLCFYRGAGLSTGTPYPQ